jgi:hypothetical protein
MKIFFEEEHDYWSVYTDKGRTRHSFTRVEADKIIKYIKTLFPNCRALSSKLCVLGKPNFDLDNYCVDFQFIDEAEEAHFILLTSDGIEI